MLSDHDSGLYSDDIQIMTVHYPLPSWLTYSVVLLCLLLRDDTSTTPTTTSKRVLGMDGICFLLYEGINRLIRGLDIYASRAFTRDLVYLACRYRQLVVRSLSS